MDVECGHKEERKMNGMNNNYNGPLTEKQVQELSSTYWKKQMDIEQNAVNKSTDMQFLKEKEQLKLNSMYAMLAAKELHARRAEEERLARCEVVEITEDGRIHIQTKNTMVDTKPRNVTNFKYINAVVYVNVDNPQERIIKIFFKMDTVGEEERFIFLNLAKCEKNTYIEKKLLTIGADIYASSKARMKDYVKKIVAYIVRNCKEIKEIPQKRGWYKYQDSIRFYDEEETWTEVMKYAE